MASLDPGRNDGPQKRRKNYNGEDPLDYEGKEAFAKLLATSRSENGLRSLTALAQTLQVARTTIHRWKKDPDVLLRAERLSRENKLDAQLLARREWPSVVAAMLASAKQGNTAAAKFCAGLAWPEEGQPGSRPFSSMSIVEACRRTENMGEIPTWLQRQKEAEWIAADARASNGNGDSDPSKLGTDGK
jgi:hypothetical protein